MDLGFKGKVVAIVGGTAGMGYAAAEVLAAEGADLALLCRNQGHGKKKAEKLVSEFGVRVEVYVADITDVDQVTVAVDQVVVDFGRLNGLAVTAGPMHKVAPFIEQTDEDWQSNFETQLMGSVRCCRAALPYLETYGGHIVLTGALSVREPNPMLSPYTAMKSAIANVSKNIAKIGGVSGIRCNCVCPGAIATDAMDEIKAAAVAKYGDTLSPEKALDRFMMEEWHLEVAMNRVGQPNEVGELIAFLLSDKAAYMTGALINIDGGSNF